MYNLSVSSDRETNTKIVKPNALSHAAMIKIKITNVDIFLWNINVWKIQTRMAASNVNKANKIDWRCKIKQVKGIKNKDKKKKWVII